MTDDPSEPQSPYTPPRSELRAEHSEFAWRELRAFFLKPEFGVGRSYALEDLESGEQLLSLRPQGLLSMTFQALVASDPPGETGVSFAVNAALGARRVTVEGPDGARGTWTRSLFGSWKLGGTAPSLLHGARLKVRFLRPPQLLGPRGALLGSFGRRPLRGGHTFRFEPGVRDLPPELVVGLVLAYSLVGG